MIFLMLEILQVIIYFITVYAACRDLKYLYIGLIWCEDVILEIPMILIAYYLTSYLNSLVSLVLVVAGGFLGVGVAIGETVMEF